MRKTALSLVLLVLTGCGTNDDWTFILTLDGVEQIQAYQPAAGDMADPSSRNLLFFEGHQLSVVSYFYFDDRVLGMPTHEIDGVYWAYLSSIAIGEETFWIGRPDRDFEALQVLSFGLDNEGTEGWIERATFPVAGGELISRHGEEPVLYDPETGAVSTLDGDSFGAVLEENPLAVLVGGDVVFEVQRWVDTGSEREVRQHRILGPDCEALLAGQLSNVIATPEGLETVSVVGVDLHHERVLPDCSVEFIEEIYHPKPGFSPSMGTHVGERSWAYWTER